MVGSLTGAVEHEGTLSAVGNRADKGIRVPPEP